MPPSVEFLRWEWSESREVVSVEQPQVVSHECVPERRPGADDAVQFICDWWPAGRRSQEFQVSQHSANALALYEFVADESVLSSAPTPSTSTAPVGFPVAVPYFSTALSATRPTTAASSKLTNDMSMVVERTDRPSVAAGGAIDVLRAAPSFGPRIESLLGISESAVIPPPVVGREAVRKAHFKVRRASAEYLKQMDKEKAMQESEVIALIPLLPHVLVLAMLGDDLGLRQVPAAQRYEQLRRRLLKRAGATGDNLAEVRLGLGTLRAYAQMVMLAEPGSEDAALFPMSLALAHEIANDEHERATENGRGSQGGKTVAWHFRGFLVRLASWGAPILATSKQLEEIVPNGKPSICPRRKAGTYPIGALCQYEFFAADAANVPLTSEAARRAVCFRCRSKLAFGTMPSLRLGAEGARVEVSLDQEHPAVICGSAWMTKDGNPIEFFAPAEGLLGEFYWYAEHAAQVIETGIPFPAWRSERGAAGSILRATEIRVAVGDSSANRKADREILTLPPLAITEQTIEELNPNGHSDHVTFPEWSRVIGERPWFGFPLSDGLEYGFTDCDGGDSEALGNWLRDDHTKSAAVAARAVEAARDAAARGEEARQAAARARAAASQGARKKMRVYYGQGGALSNRAGERAKQLDVRQRLVRTVREVVATKVGDWRKLPSGLADTGVLRSTRGSARASLSFVER